MSAYRRGGGIHERRFMADWGQTPGQSKTPPVERDVNFNSTNEPSCGFPPYFPRISPLRWRAIRENLPDMNLGHSKRQETAKRPHELRQAVRGNSRDLSERVLLEPTQASNE